MHHVADTLKGFLTYAFKTYLIWSPQYKKSWLLSIDKLCPRLLLTFRPFPMKMHDPKANCSWQSPSVCLEYLQMQHHLTGSEEVVPTRCAFGKNTGILCHTPGVLITWCSTIHICPVLSVLTIKNIYFHPAQFYQLLHSVSQTYMEQLRNKWKHISNKAITSSEVFSPYFVSKVSFHTISQMKTAFLVWSSCW